MVGSGGSLEEAKHSQNYFGYQADTAGHSHVADKNQDNCLGLDCSAVTASHTRLPCIKTEPGQAAVPGNNRCDRLRPDNRWDPKTTSVKKKKGFRPFLSLQ